MSNIQAFEYFYHSKKSSHLTLTDSDQQKFNKKKTNARQDIADTTNLISFEFGGVRSVST